MPRRSSRLAAKKRVNYNVDSYFDRVLGSVKSGWQKTVTRLEAKPVNRRSVPKPPKAFKKKQFFRKKAPKPKPRVPKEIVRVKKRVKSKFEKEIEVIDLTGDSPELRMEKIRDRKVYKPLNKVATKRTISRKHKHLLFMNPGDEKIMEALYAFQGGTQLPKWAWAFQNNLKNKDGRLVWFEDDRGGILERVFALKEEKRKLVKENYFDPRMPSTIEPITAKLREQWANITKRDVTNVLRSLETYQRNFGRRKPPDIKNRMFLYNPGMIAMDMFFPTVKNGWRKFNCLTCMDSWSRYCGLYAITSKKYEDVVVCMSDFLSKFASLGHMPRRILSDKGSDMAAAKLAIEKYRKAKDGDKPLVLHTATGTPVLIVEGLNAQVQRRMQIFATSGLSDNPAQILHEIAEQLNNEPRQARGGLTPLQLLALDQSGRDLINKNYRDRVVPNAEVAGLVDLKVGDWVRLLLMNRKEQEQGKLKGFSAKWSEEIYEVIKKTALRKNAFAFRYSIGLPDTYYRHELYKIHAKKIDADVPQNTLRTKEVQTGKHGEEAEYVPSDEEWDRDDDA